MQSIQSLQPLRQIMTQTYARYATITPLGIVLPAGPTPYNPLPVTIIAHRPARTLYVNRHPLCRSLNGINSVNGRKRCICCEDKQSCTPQISLEILYRSVPFRIMLAYTSAKNFISFRKTFQAPQRYVDEAFVEISVIDRGRWGEACFAEVKSAGTM